MLGEGEGVTFGVEKSEEGGAGAVFGKRTGLEIVGKKKFAHTRNVRSGEGDLGEKIVRSAAGDLLEFEALPAVDGKARMGHAEATVVTSGEAEELTVENGRGVEIGGVETDRGDTRDGRAGLAGRGDREVKEAEEVKEVKERTGMRA